MADSMTRSELAKRCAVNTETLRYYEQRGLLPKPTRSASNYRLYSHDDVRRVRFIKRAQALGFTLKEIQELLSLRAAQGSRCADVLAQAESKIRDIDEKIQTLSRMRDTLSSLKDQCRGSLPITECPVLDALNPEDADGDSQ